MTIMIELAAGCVLAVASIPAASGPLIFRMSTATDNPAADIPAAYKRQPALAVVQATASSSLLLSSLLLLPLLLLLRAFLLLLTYVPMLAYMLLQTSVLLLGSVSSLAPVLPMSCILLLLASLLSLTRVRRLLQGTNVVNQRPPFWSGLKSTSPAISLQIKSRLLLAQLTKSAKFVTKTVASVFSFTVQSVKCTLDGVKTQKGFGTIAC